MNEYLCPGCIRIQPQNIEQIGAFTCARCLACGHNWLIAGPRKQQEGTTV